MSSPSAELAPLRGASVPLHGRQLLLVAAAVAGVHLLASQLSPALVPYAAALPAGTALALALRGRISLLGALLGVLSWPLLAGGGWSSALPLAAPALAALAVTALVLAGTAGRSVSWRRRVLLALGPACIVQVLVAAALPPLAGAAAPALLGAPLGLLLGAAPVLAWWRHGMARAGGFDASTTAAALLALASAALAASRPGPLAVIGLAAPALLAWVAARLGTAPSTLAAAGVAWTAALLLTRGGGSAPWAAWPGTPALVLGWTALLLAATLVAGRAADAQRRQERRWRLALESADIGVAEWYVSGRIGFLSERWRMLLGDPEGLHSATPWAWLQQVHEDDREQVQQALRTLRRPGQERWQQELRLKRGSRWDWFEFHLQVAARDAKGEPERLVATIEDVGERRGAQERQRLSASLFQHLHEGLLITDAELRVLDLNPTYSQIMGVSRQDLLGSVPALLSPSTDAQTRAQQTAMWASLHATGTWRGEMAQRRSNGESCTLQVTISAVRGSDNEVRYHVLVISDITEQRVQRERLERQAHFDELTRLPNRARLSQMLADAMAAAEREGYLLAVCYLDLDHFKPVNDRFGHAAGDRLLIELAQRLGGALRSSAVWSDTAARLGGDEFVLLLRAGTLDEAKLAVERVLRVIGQPYVIEPDAEPVLITASVGATVYPLDRSDAETLLRHADHAMYGAKQSGRNGYLFFDAESSRRTEQRVMAIGRVQEALDRHELVLHYQPKVDMRRGQVLGVEVLLRWNHPEHGLIPPAQFLPLIEQTGLSARMGDWVLEQALEQLVHWQRMGLDLAVSVNVSARHLQEPDFAQRLAELLARHKRPLGPRLELEVLETAALADVEYTSGLLERCRKLGVRFALDDFGTGYSTLTYLKRLPVDVLKIDRSFVHSMLDDRQDLAIVEGVIGLARTFGCSVVAEGVETPAQARLLIEMGCDIGQGMGIGMPMPASEIYRWVRDYRGVFSLAAMPALPPLPSAAGSQRIGPE